MPIDQHSSEQLLVTPSDQADISKAAKLAKAKLIALIDGPKLTQMIASVQQSGNMQAQQ